MENELSQINFSDEKELIKYNEKINKSSYKIENFINYDLELNLLSMKIGIKEEIKDLLFKNIQECYFLDVEYMDVAGEIPTIRHILQKNKYWSCICGELVK